MGDALREVTVNGVRYFQASDVERWHRGNVARAEEWDALSERVAELEDALRWIQEFAAGTNQHGIVHTVPPLGMVTMVDASKTRHKRDPGRCYRKAGFRHVGFTQSGLWVFQMLEDEMPEPLALWETETRREPSRALARDDEIRHPGFGSIRARTDAAQPTEAVA